MAAVLAANLPRAGKSSGVPLKLSEFVGFVARLAWAKANGCPWGVVTCELGISGRERGGAAVGAGARLPV
jgi:hypothetical protein